MRMLALLTGSVMLAGIVTARSGGISGHSISGATCHSSTPSASVNVTITGIPANYTPTNTYALQVTVTGTPTAGGGFDMSVTAGTLSTTDANARILNGEATNSNGIARSWAVDWRAPAAGAGTVTFYVVGLASNNNGGTGGDGWNRAAYTSNELTPNNPPTASLTSPGGTQDWTGGSSHTITWTMRDDLTPAASLKVYLNYSSVAGSGAIAGPLTGATSFAWTVPSIDATDVRVNATVINQGGLKGYSQVLVPKVDSTRPTVSSATPTGTGVSLTAPIAIRFSETMDKVSSQAAFSLVPDPGGLVFAWSQTTFVDDTVTISHASFASSTTHTATVGAGAKDVSDPGNSLAAQHQWTFTTVAGNSPPSITVTIPTGGEDWTGGSVQNLDWTASDAEDAAASLKVWVNYSLTGIAPFDHPIAGLQGVAGSARPYAWTLPLENSATIVLNATVVDTARARGYGLSAQFQIDSIAPTVLSTSPNSRATGVPIGSNVLTTWSEPMGKPSAEGAFSLKDTATWTAVSGAFSWTGDTMMFDPTTALLPGTQYSANITTSAADISQPGNHLAMQYAWTFTTAAGTDTEKPTITDVSADPDPQEVFLHVNITAVVRDNVAVSGVWVNVTDPLGGSRNSTMGYDIDEEGYYLDAAYDVVGVHHFVVWAVDSSSNWESASGSFRIRDTTPPTITDLKAVPNPANVSTQMNISAVVADNYQLSTVSVLITAPDSVSTNRSMSPGARFYSNLIASLAGTYHFRVWASDSSGNWNSAAGTFLSRDDVPPAAPLNLAVQNSGSKALRLTWTAGTETDLAGYNVYRSLSAGGPYTKLNTNGLLSDATYLDDNLGDGTYYYVVTAVDSSGNESGRSNEASGHIASSTGQGGPVAAEDIRWLLVFAASLAILGLLLAILVAGGRKKNKEDTDSPSEAPPQKEEK